MTWLLILGFWLIPTIIFFCIWYVIWSKETKEEYLYEFLTGDRFFYKYDMLVPSISMMFIPLINWIFLIIWTLGDVRGYLSSKISFKWFNIKLRNINEQN